MLFVGCVRVCVCAYSILYARIYHLFYNMHVSCVIFTGRRIGAQVKRMMYSEPHILHKMLEVLYMHAHTLARFVLARPLACTHARKRSRAHTHTYARARTHTHTHAHTHTRAHSLALTHTHKHTILRTHVEPIPASISIWRYINPYPHLYLYIDI